MLRSVLEQPCPELTLLAYFISSVALYHLSKLVVEYNLDDGKTIQCKADLETTLN